MRNEQPKSLKTEVDEEVTKKPRWDGKQLGWETGIKRNRTKRRDSYETETVAEKNINQMKLHLHVEYMITKQWHRRRMKTETKLQRRFGLISVTGNISKLIYCLCPPSQTVIYTKRVFAYFHVADGPWITLIGVELTLISSSLSLDNMWKILFCWKLPGFLGNLVKCWLIVSDRLLVSASVTG